MCYNPRTIKNPSKHFDIEHDKVFLTVPCGQCGDCRNNKRTSYQVRCFYEWQHAKLLGGYCLFVTLTYNDKHLPTLFGFPCFDYKDIQDFFKRCRKTLSYKYNIKSDAFTYIVSMEYGGETCRPHYHLLIFVKDKTINEFVMRSVIRDSWSVERVKFEASDGSFYFKDLPRNGFIKFGNNRGIVDSSGAIEYVTKYCCKDFDFEEKFCELYGCKDSDILHAYSSFRPKTKTSINFGLYALECTSDDLLLSGKCTYTNKDGVKIVPLPLYLERKKFFDVIRQFGESPRYKLNSSGIFARGIRFDAMLQAVENHIDTVLHNRDYISELGFWLDCLSEKSPYKSIASDFFSPLDMLDYLLKDSSFSISELARYMVGYRGFIGRFVDDLSFDDVSALFQYHVDTNYTIYDCVSRDCPECSQFTLFERFYQVFSCLSYLHGCYLDACYKSDAKKLSNYKRAI